MNINERLRHRYSPAGLVCNEPAYETHQKGHSHIRAGVARPSSNLCACHRPPGDFILGEGWRIRLQQPFAQWASVLTAMRGFDLAPLDLEVIAEAHQLTFTDDPFDAAIVATARIKDLPLVTKDSIITDSGIVEVAW
jgi:hypothetical protein